MTRGGIEGFAKRVCPKDELMVRQRNKGGATCFALGLVVGLLVGLQLAWYYSPAANLLLNSSERRDDLKNGEHQPTQTVVSEQQNNSDEVAAPREEDITEKDIIIAIHTYSKKIGGVAEGKKNWLKDVRTYAFSDQYDDKATQAGINVVKFKDESPKEGNGMSDCRATMAFGFVRELLETDPSILWVLFGDDDTYFFLSRILPKLAQYDPYEKWLLAPAIHGDHFYGGEGGFISRGAFLALSHLDMWTALGRYSKNGGDVRVSHMLKEMAPLNITHVKDWEATRHRVHGGEMTYSLCKQEKRCN